MGDAWLLGLQAKGALVLGTFDTSRRFLAQRGGDSEVDLEQDLFGAARIAERGQIAVLVPLVETRRATPGLEQLGGGLGDVNLSARWDFFHAGRSRLWPGLALLAGVTFPTGKPSDAASPPLQADATGIGAFQIQGALALEQTFGPWLVNATAIVAARTEHDGETLAPQVTALLAGSYTFPNDAAVALSASYAFEGDASCSAGSAVCPAGASAVPGSAKAVSTVAVSGLWPVAESWRLLGGLSLTPPLYGFGENAPASGGMSLTVVRSWL
jgi:hypothetical protein